MNWNKVARSFGYISLAFYLLAAFIAWDMSWLASMNSALGARLILLLIMCVSFLIAVGVEDMTRD